MARVSTAFFCTDCGNETPRWQGQCPACQAWNTLVEEPSAKTRGSRTRDTARVASKTDSTPIRLRDVEAQSTARWSTGIDELDFVLGGGIVSGSLVLLGGEPGVGKSTLLLQDAGLLEKRGLPTLYVSGEESAAQVRLRADRMQTTDVTFFAETDLKAIIDTAARAQPAVVVIDSIQTVFQ